jgi:hypothetical protein
MRELPLALPLRPLGIMACVHRCRNATRSAVLGGGLVLVRGGGACRAVGGGLRSGAALVDVCLDVVPLPPRSSSPTVAGCRLGGFLART